MIIYDGKKWRTLVKLEGSVIPKALPYATFIAIVAVLLKYADDNGTIAISRIELVKNSAAYTGFTFALSFVLVFRSSQCYSRFWSCAQSACTMRAQVCESASSLITFSIMTKKTKEETRIFAHKVVRLFSLLHACALQQISDQEDENFRTIDTASLGPEHLSVLAQLDGRGKVDMVYQWIGALIMESTISGLLNVPPPVLSRVFQEMEKAMIEYNQVMQVMTIPFPFPYAQVSVMLLCIYMFCTPIVMCHFVGNAAVAGFFTFVSVLCMVSLEFIAAELEGPLGDDANDLPCYLWQEDLNETLLSFLSPWCNSTPDLLPTALIDLESLEKLGMRAIDDVLAEVQANPTYKNISRHELCWTSDAEKKASIERAAAEKKAEAERKVEQLAAQTSQKPAPISAPVDPPASPGKPLEAPMPSPVAISSQASSTQVPSQVPSENTIPSKSPTQAESMSITPGARPPPALSLTHTASHLAVIEGNGGQPVHTQYAEMPSIHLSASSVQWETIYGSYQHQASPQVAFPRDAQRLPIGDMSPLRAGLLVPPGDKLNGHSHAAYVDAFNSSTRRADSAPGGAANSGPFGLARIRSEEKSPEPPSTLRNGGADVRLLDNHAPHYGGIHGRAIGRSGSPAIASV